jgi:hypothetical protein
LEEKIFCELGFARDVLEELRGGKSAGRFIAVDGSKDSDADGVAAVGPAKGEMWQGIFLTLNLK